MTTVDEILYGFPTGQSDVQQLTGEDLLMPFWHQGTNQVPTNIGNYSYNTNSASGSQETAVLSSLSDTANSLFFNLPNSGGSFSSPLSWRTSGVQQQQQNVRQTSSGVSNQHLHHMSSSGGVGNKNAHMQQPPPLSSENHKPSYQQNNSLGVKHPVPQVPATPQTTDFYGSSANNLAEFFNTSAPFVTGSHFHQHENYYQTAPSSLFPPGCFNERQHIPISPSWLERPPAPGDADWTRFGPSKSNNSANSTSKLLRGTAGISHQHGNNDRRRLSSGFVQEIQRPFIGAISSNNMDDLDSQESECGDGTARYAANIRERRRMRLLNEAFGRLRSHIPQDFFSEHKRSKLTVLRGAIRYIKLLSDTLIARGGTGKANASLNVTSTGQPGRTRQQMQPQSVVITSASLNTRHRVSWRISNGAAASIGRFSPRPSATTEDGAGVFRGNKHQPQHCFQDVRLRYVTWRPTGTFEAEADC